MNLIQQNNTSRKIVVLLTTPDHVSGATGLTLTTTRSKNGGSFAAWAGGAAELANGWYALTPAAGDVDTLGELAIHVTAAGADPADVKYTVVAFDPYDAVRGGLSALPNAAAGTAGGLAVGDPLAQAVPGTYASGTAGSRLGLLGAGSVTVVSPVSVVSGGDLEIVRGDDYTASSGRALPEWASAGWSVYDLSAAESITFRAKTRYSEMIFAKAAEAVSDTQVRVELTAAETGGLAVGREAYRFDVEAVLASGDVVTLAQGYMHVIEDVH